MIHIITYGTIFTIITQKNRPKIYQKMYQNLVNSKWVHIFILKAAQNSTAVHDGEHCTAQETNSNDWEYIIIDEGQGKDGPFYKGGVHLRVVQHNPH